MPLPERPVSDCVSRGFFHPDACGVDVYAGPAIAQVAPISRLASTPRSSHVARVMYKDLEVDSPYNTYRHVGLPPGPIASPGRPSIVAALNPAKVPYRYFVAYPDGHHEFTTDFAKHSIAVRNARREWDSVSALRRDTGRAPMTAPAAPMRR